MAVGGGDEEEEWTYIGGGRISMVDFVVTNGKAGELVEKVEVGRRVESDQPTEVVVEGKIQREGVSRVRG